MKKANTKQDIFGKNGGRPAPNPCKTCEDASVWTPTHDGSAACRNKHDRSIAAGGTATHCTCTGCF